jgi:uncharacterized protein (DUF2132 family)
MHTRERDEQSTIGLASLVPKIEQEKNNHLQGSKTVIVVTWLVDTLYFKGLLWQYSIRVECFNKTSELWNLFFC